MPAEMNIRLRRNEDWARSMQLLADGPDGDEPIDLTGCTVEMRVREQLTDTLIAEADITLTDADEGWIDITLPGEGALIEYGDPLHTYEFPYDLRLTEPGGDRVDLLAGKVIVERGIT